MRILIWHLHGSWLTSFVQGPHEYLVPVNPERGPFGLGRARTWEWPASVVELSAGELRDGPGAPGVLSRPDELGLPAAWLGPPPGRDIPAVYLEHATPPGVGVRHPMAGVAGLTIVHVTQFTDLFWA